jgi:uncharacterized surface protein with fasciclin (FAS1) repeats
MSTTVKQETRTNILETANSTGDFKLLTQAIEAAGLTDTLRTQGPFTVFAPNDEAFRKLPTGTMEGLMKDVPKLKGILSYHVIDHKMSMDEIRNMTAAGKTWNVKTLQGSELALKPRDYVNNSRIVKSDIETTNGIIHVIDQVLMPMSTQ